MSGLGSLQRLISDAIRRRSSVADRALAARISEIIAPGAHDMSPADRIGVYREQFWLRHVSNLEEDYPTLAWVIGADAFRELVTEYLEAFPPRHWNLERLGQDLPSFLLCAQPSPSTLACDAARLDWAFMEAFSAPDVPPFDDSVLAGGADDAWPYARVVFHPSVRPLALAHPLKEARESVQRGEPPRPPPPRETHLVVWRDHAFYLRSITVERNAFELLRALMAGSPLGAACENVVASSPEVVDADEVGRHIARWFQEWRANAWLSAVTLP